MKILIAEDDYASRVILEKVLSKHGSCDSTINGIETMDAYTMAIEEGQPYDLVCLDIMMPLLDGEKVLEKIRQIEKKIKNYNVKVIIISALYDEELLMRLKGMDLLHYMVKPLDINALNSIIEKIH